MPIVIRSEYPSVCTSSYRIFSSDLRPISTPLRPTICRFRYPPHLSPLALPRLPFSFLRLHLTPILTIRDPGDALEGPCRPAEPPPAHGGRPGTSARLSSRRAPRDVISTLATPSRSPSPSPSPTTPPDLRHDTIQYDTTRYDTVRYDTTRYSAIRYPTPCPSSCRRPPP